MNKLRQKIENQEFVVSAELMPPKDCDLGAFKKAAEEMAANCDLLIIPDNPGAEARVDALCACHALGDVAAAVMPALNCRDYNRLALKSRVLGAAAMGVDGLLFVSGDHSSMGPEPGAKSVYDLDSVQALAMAGEVLNGADSAPMLAATTSPLARPEAMQLLKMHKKLKAGAGLIISRAVQSMDDLSSLAEAAVKNGACFMAGIDAAAMDAQAALDLISAARGSDSTCGVHLFDAGSEAGLGLLQKISA